MSALRRRTATRAAALANREQYLRLLQERLPEVGPSSLSRGALQDAKRARLHEAVRAGELTLPENWMTNAARALHLACPEVFRHEVLARNDLFLCSLIHPTFIAPNDGSKSGKAAAARLRRTIAMPLETSLSGAAALQLVRQVLAAHHRGAEAPSLGRRDRDGSGGQGEQRGHHTSSLGSSSSSGWSLDDGPVLTPRRLARIPQAAGIDGLLLYGKGYFSSAAAGAAEEKVPEEVRLAAVSSLCGAVDLCFGAHGVAEWLDRMLPRLPSSNEND